MSVLRTRVLFVTYGGGHISMMLPVMRALELAHPEFDCVLMALTTGLLKAKAVRPTLGYHDFLDLVDAPAALAWGEKLSRGNTSPDVPLHETLAYLGINYLDLIAQYGQAGAAEHYSQQGRYGFAPLHFMRRVLEKLSPDVVVATNSPRSEQAVLQVAKERGIPCVGLVDMFGMDSDPYVLRPIKPDWTCVIAESVRDRLLVRGFPPDAVEVTGNPAFDGLFSLSNQEQANAFMARQGWTGKKLVLYIGAWEPVPHAATDIPAGRSFPIALEAILRRYVAARPDTVLVVRYHPGDWFEYPRVPVDAESDRVYFSEPPAEPIHPLILAASVVVTTNSTVGLEAAVAGKPVISIENSPSVHHWFSLAKLGVSYPSATHLELPATLDEVLRHGQPLRSYSSDGHAASRVANVVARAAHGLR